MGEPQPADADDRDQDDGAQGQADEHELHGGQAVEGELDP
jgi:hypothetical protein